MYQGKDVSDTDNCQFWRIKNNRMYLDSNIFDLGSDIGLNPSVNNCTNTTN